MFCYNFMAQIGWYRVKPCVPGRSGAPLSNIHVKEKAEKLTEPGEASPDRTSENYQYFIRRVMPAAEKGGILLALHPHAPALPFLPFCG